MLALLFFTSCPPAAEAPDDFDAAQLYKHSWELQRFEFEGKTEAGSGNATLVFGDEGQLGGNSGCNSFGGDHKVMGNQLIIGPMMMTKMFCQDVALQEGAIIRILGDTVTMRMEGEELHLSNDGGLLVYGPAKEAISQGGEEDTSGSLNTEALAAHNWELTHYEVDGQLENAKKMAFLSFTNPGSVGGSSGCNSFGANYDVIGQHIVTKDMEMTEMYCEEYAGQEAAIATVLGDTAELIISEGKLHIRNQSGTLIYSPAAESATTAVQAVAAERNSSEEVGGLFVYMADAAGFQPCSGGESYPVSMEKGYLACEKAYSAMEKYGEPAYIVVRGYTAPNPQPEGKRTIFVIEELVRSTPETVCP